MSSRIVRAVFISGTLLSTLACGANGDGSMILLDGLSQPRGIFASGRLVCVAEAGSISPDGPVREQPGQLEADTGRVICRDGTLPAETVIDGLPFVYYPEAGVTSGATDVALVDGRMFVLIGESYGLLARSIVELTPSHVERWANLLAHAEATAEASGGAVRSNPYSFVASKDGASFLVADAATGTILGVTREGVEVFASVPGHDVLTGLVWGPDGRLYVTSFGSLPHPIGSSVVLAIDANGQHEIVHDGLTMAIDIAFDDRGGLFVLEYSSNDDVGESAYRDGRGRLLYVAALGSNEAVEVAAGLDRPTALAIDDDHVLVSLSAGQLAAGEGAVRAYAIEDLLDGVRP